MSPRKDTQESARSITKKAAKKADDEAAENRRKKSRGVKIA